MEHISQTLASMALATPELLRNTLASGASATNRQPISLRPETVAKFFDDFDAHGEPALERMRLAAIAFVAAMCSADTPAHWLVLLGPSGTGKTMIARAINRVFQKFIEGALDEIRNMKGGMWRRAGGFLSWPKCMDWMMESDFGFMRQACDDWFLVLDDIGAEHTRLRDLSASKLFAICNAREHKFTVVTANLGLDEIGEKLDARIASRLIRHGAHVIDTTGTPDFNTR